MRCLALSLLCTAVMAQSDRGAIRGRILDGSQPVSSAPLEAKHAGSGTVYKTVSSASGSYALDQLPAGNYEVRVAVEGFRKKDLAIQASQTVELDFLFEADFQLATLGDGDIFSRIARLRSPIPPGGPPPRTPDGKPDLSGVWAAPKTVESNEPELLPDALKMLNERFANNGKYSPAAYCMPDAVLRLSPFFKIIQSPAVIMVVIEAETPGYYQVFLDGRAHPKEPNPIWYGHAIGKWDGDTLVVETVGFNDRRWLTQFGTPLSEKLHITERFRRPDRNHLEIETSVDDPGVYPKPRTMKRVADLAPAEEIMESICNENNKDAQHMAGK